MHKNDRLCPLIKQPDQQKCKFTHESVKKQQTAPQMAKLRRIAFPPMEKNAQPSQIVPNSILRSLLPHTRGQLLSSLSPRSSGPLYPLIDSAPTHPPAQQISPHKGLAEAQAEREKNTERERMEGSSQREGNGTWAARHAGVRHLRWPPRRAASRIQLESTEPRPDLVTPCRAPQICARSSSEVAVRG